MFSLSGLHYLVDNAHCCLIGRRMTVFVSKEVNDKGFHHSVFVLITGVCLCHVLCTFGFMEKNVLVVLCAAVATR